MSMGGGSGNVSPVRSSSRPRASTRDETPSSNGLLEEIMEETRNGSGEYEPVSPSTPTTSATSYGRSSGIEEELSPVEPTDSGPAKPIYIAVGGGLSNRRIITKLAPDFCPGGPENAPIEDVIRYLTSSEVATSPADGTVVDDVNDRIGLPDCRIVINDVPGLGQSYNRGRESLGQTLGDYLVTKEQQTQGGPVEVKFADFSVLSHDEGGYKFFK